LPDALCIFFREDKQAALLDAVVERSLELTGELLCEEVLFDNFSNTFLETSRALLDTLDFDGLLPRCRERP